MDIIYGRHCYIQARQEALANVFDLANDSQHKHEILAQPTRALMDAVVCDNQLKFEMALSLAQYPRAALGKALFYAVGFERHAIRQRLIQRGAPLREEANGLLLRDVLNGNINGVRYSLRKTNRDGSSYVDVNASDDECFKQAILSNRFDIADLLYGAGADVAAACSDRRFYNKVYYTGNVSRETRAGLIALLGDMSCEKDQFDFNPPL